MTDSSETSFDAFSAEAAITEHSDGLKAKVSVQGVLIATGPLLAEDYRSLILNLR